MPAHLAVLERREVVGVDVVRRAAVEGLPLGVVAEHVVQRVARHLGAVEPCREEERGVRCSC